MITTLYEKLKERNYKTYTVCQLPGCSKPLKRKFHQKIRKYCCTEHAQEAKKIYLKEWKLRNKENVSIWNKRYAKNRKKRIKEGLIS